MNGWKIHSGFRVVLHVLWGPLTPLSSLQYVGLTRVEYQSTYNVYMWV
jgi:hypothetical protein